MLVFPSFSRHQPLISMQTPLRILGIAGSLRQQSFNLALLKAAPEYNHGIPGVPKLH
jgi:NAD(P)H-dependent FMN reductase